MTPNCSRRLLRRITPAHLRVWLDRPPTFKDHETIVVGGIERTYWMAPPCETSHGTGTNLPLLIGLHGQSSSGSRLAWWSGLGARAPCAGFLGAFPDARDTVWDDHGCGRRDGADDYEMIARLIDHLSAKGQADLDRVFITGVSSGASLAERVARIGTLRVRGVGLVTGTARRASHDTTRITGGPTPILMFAGTRDPMLPYAGGAETGFLSRTSTKLIKLHLNDPSGHEFVGPELLAAEWARANLCESVPLDEPFPNHPDDARVRRLTWMPAAPDGAPVVLYRTDGGHGWPGGRQYLPQRMIGKIPQYLDGTGIVLEFARRVVNGESPITSVPASNTGAKSY